MPSENSRFDPRRLLGRANLYQGLQRFLGGNAPERLVRDHIRPRKGDRVLDIGCGPARILAWLGDVEYVGFDASAAYIEKARRRYGSRGRFVNARLEDADGDDFRGFDLVLALGVVHHLDDDAAQKLYRFALNALRPAGRFVSNDGCFVEGQSAAARMLLSLDRGDYVRRLDDHLRLAHRVFSSPRHVVLHDLARVPYTHLIIEATREI